MSRQRPLMEEKRLQSAGSRRLSAISYQRWSASLPEARQHDELFSGNAHTHASFPERARPKTMFQQHIYYIVDPANVKGKIACWRPPPPPSLLLCSKWRGWLATVSRILQPSLNTVRYRADGGLGGRRT